MSYVDPRGPRFGAWVTTAVLAAVLVTGSAWLSAAQTLVFAAGAVAGLKAAPYGVLFRRLVAPRLAPPAELEAELPPEPGEVYGDHAFAGTRPEGIIRARGGTPRMVHTGTWGGPEALARLEAHNAEVRRVRARIEK